MSIDFKIGDKVEYEQYELYSDKVTRCTGRIERINTYWNGRTITVFVQPDEDLEILVFNPKELKKV